MIKLTDEEIDNITFEWDDLYQEGKAVLTLKQTIADAQVKKFAEWLKSEVLEDCHEGYSNVMCFHRRALKALLEE